MSYPNTQPAVEAVVDVPIGGLTLRLATWGSSAATDRAVLLVHGLTASSRAWADIGPPLAARGWYAIAPDLRGRGLSDKPRYGYALPIHAADLLTIIDTLGLAAVRLVGHSLGAMIGLFMAAVHRDRIAGLALIDGGGKLPSDTFEAIAPALARLGTVYPSLDAFLAAMCASPNHPWDAYWDRYYRYDAEVRPDGAVVSRVPKSAIDQEGAALWATRIEALAEVVETPTLIARSTRGLLGDTRGFVLTGDEAEWLRAVIPGSRLVEIAETNHYTILQAPGLLEVLLDWLDGDA